MEQVVGIEPTSSAWKADILAFVRYLQMVGVARFELACRSTDFESAV